jgi:hypothetical protein
MPRSPPCKEPKSWYNKKDIFTGISKVIQAMEAETNVQGLIQKAYENLKTSDAASAVSALEEAIRVDF